MIDILALSQMRNTEMFSPRHSLSRHLVTEFLSLFAFPCGADCGSALESRAETRSKFDQALLKVVSDDFRQVKISTKPGYLPLELDVGH